MNSRRLSQQFGHRNRTSKGADHSDGHDHSRSHDSFAQAEACYDDSKRCSRRLSQEKATTVLGGMIAMMVIGHMTIFVQAIACYDEYVR